MRHKVGAFDDLRANAARRLGQKGRTIRRLFPSVVSEEAREAFVREAQTAIALYVAWLPPTDDESRIDYRGSRAANRPNDRHRHGLISDLFDAYTTAREEDCAARKQDVLQARGFQTVANAVLRAAGISFTVTDHDLTTVRSKRKPFVAFVEQQAGKKK